MIKPLKRSFFERTTLEVAPELLGKTIFVKCNNGKTRSGIIVEVEAYTNDDPACHAARGITPRNAIMFGKGGFSYVYFIYGMYFCLNFVTEKEGIPGAVLIRALEVPLKEDPKIASGPGKLCKYLKLTKKHNGIDCCNKNSTIIVTNNNSYKNFSIVQTNRIGISQAAHLPWRWYIKNNDSVSKIDSKIDK